MRYEIRVKNNVLSIFWLEFEQEQSKTVPPIEMQVYKFFAVSLAVLLLVGSDCCELSLLIIHLLFDYLFSF